MEYLTELSDLGIPKLARAEGREALITYNI